ncbi:hypothetical protein LP7551_03563 [Roseibium album]|nr:hypothetical protein LP7551_03563 [Roseibium album]
MIEAVMYVALGFCTAGLIGLAILPAFYRRAARLTEEALRAVNPSSYAEVRAAQDQARARHAVELRRVERQLESERDKAAKFHLDASSLKQEIAGLNKIHEKKISDLEAKIAEQVSDQQAVDLLSTEVNSLKQKLSEAEKALAQSWAESADDLTNAKQTAAPKDDTGWLPATDTMALATITGLEAEAATLKARLAKYEPVVAAEIEASLEETARSQLAKQEAQLVEIESKYVTAQAEVTRLSLLLETANLEETGRQGHLNERFEELASDNAQHIEDLEIKERTLERLTGQVQKLQKDLAETPQLMEIRKELLGLTARISKAKSISISVKGTNKAAPSVSVKPGMKATAKRARRPAAVNRPKRPAADVNQVQSNKVGSDLPSGKSTDIATAAEALVSRIVASNRSQEKSKRKEKTVVAAKSQIESAQETAVSVKPGTTKQNNKDVA